MENLSKEKQIDNMAKDLCHTETCDTKKLGIRCYHRCKAHIYATRAIDKGYAKASEVAREIIDTLKSAGINEHRYPVIAELKKKYESEKDK